MGDFRYNVYILGGILSTIIGAFLLYFIQGPMNSLYGMAAISTYYINLSIFLAFAASYPDMQLLLYFVIPVKIKWLAYLDVAYLSIIYTDTDLVHQDDDHRVPAELYRVLFCHQELQPYQSERSTQAAAVPKGSPSQNGTGCDKA